MKFKHLSPEQRQQKRLDYLKTKYSKHLPEQIAGIAHALHEIFSRRLKRMKDREHRLFEGCAKIVRNHKKLGGMNLDQRARIIFLLHSIDLPMQNPDLFLHLQLTSAYAQAIASAVTANDASMNLDPEAFARIRLLRNIATAFGEAGYHRKLLVSRGICELLAVEPGYIAYLRPPSVDASGLTPRQYSEMNPSERLEHAVVRQEKIWETLTLEQKILEIAGFLAKVEDGELLRYEDIRHKAWDSRKDSDAYLSFTGKQADFFNERYATSSLNPEFEGAWLRIYDQIKVELEQLGVNFQELYDEQALKFGLSKRAI